MAKVPSCHVHWFSPLGALLLRKSVQCIAWFLQKVGAETTFCFFPGIVSSGPSGFALHPSPLLSAPGGWSVGTAPAASLVLASGWVQAVEVGGEEGHGLDSLPGHLVSCTLRQGHQASPVA